MKKQNTAHKIAEEELSQSATSGRELKIALSTEVYSNLVRQALVQGCTVEELIANMVEKLSRSGR